MKVCLRIKPVDSHLRQLPVKVITEGGQQKIFYNSDKKGTGSKIFTFKNVHDGKKNQEEVYHNFKSDLIHSVTNGVRKCD